MKSVISELNSEEFPHVRVGTGAPIFKELLISYVIEKIDDKQYEKLKPAIEKASKAVPDIIAKGIELAMNLYN